MTDSAVRPTISEITCIAVKMRMCDHTDDSMGNQRCDGHRNYPALDVDATTTKDQQELRYHPRDGEKAIIEGKGTVELQVMDIEREDARKYSRMDVVIWEGIEPLEGVIGHYTTVQSRPSCRAGS